MGELGIGGVAVKAYEARVLIFGAEREKAKWYPVRKTVISIYLSTVSYYTLLWQCGQASPPRSCVVRVTRDSRFGFSISLYGCYVRFHLHPSPSNVKGRK